MTDAMSVVEPEVDESLYSRQLYVFGHEAQLKLAGSSVLVVGLQGVGVEIAKNVILAGVKSLDLLDDQPVQLRDLGAQFYLSESDVGQPRAAACRQQLSTLNAYVDVKAITAVATDAPTASGISVELLKQKQYSTVVLCGQPLSVQTKINDYCHANDIQFVAADVYGVAARVFVDLGREHVTVDPTGEQPQRGLIVHVSSAAADVAVVTAHEDHRHGLSDGDYVRFEEVSGMTELNTLERPCKIKVLSPYTFSIDVDTTTMTPYSGTKGYYQQVVMPKTITTMRPLSVVNAAPHEYYSNDNAWNFNTLHYLYMALAEFRAVHDFEGSGDVTGGRRPTPRPDSPDDAAWVAAKAQALYDAAQPNGNTGDDCVELDASLLTLLARPASAHLCPMAAYIGGVAGQEVLKACTHKFTPMQQLFYFEAASALPQHVPVTESSADDETTVTPTAVDYTQFTPQQCRYDDQIATFGADVHQTITQTSLFLVGAGAIGCEMIKNFALMGVATAATSASSSSSTTPTETSAAMSRPAVHITDMDTIEKSNLNRQFLFRPHNVGQMKSDAAAAAAVAMNKDIHISARSLRVGGDSENVYDEDFWQSIDGVCTALDNVDARLYCDARCVYFQRPMVDSGTLGAKGNTQVVLPFITESYGSSRDPPEEGIPICTLKHFPSKIEHTIQWARDRFEGAFKQGPYEVNAFVAQQDYIASLHESQQQQLTAAKTVRSYLVSDKPMTFADCVSWARCEWQTEFHNNIVQLLTAFPADSLQASGQPFWSGAKRAPTALVFDATDPLHMEYVVAAANLRASTFGLTGTRDTTRIAALLADVVVPPFTPKAAVKIAANDEEEKKMQEEAAAAPLVEFEDELAAVTKDLPERATLVGYKLSEAEFEKDDDTNFHMAYITATSNLRARCYAIAEQSVHQTKFIAGKIIPAIATTTALVTGLVCLEWYKILQRKRRIESYRNNFVNLALPFLSYSEPFAPATHKVTLGGARAGPWAWSLWDRIDIDIGVDATLQDLLDHFEKEYGLEITMLSYGAAMIYYDFGAGPKPKVAKRLKLTVARAVEKVAKIELGAGERYLTLEVCASNAEGDEEELPTLRYKFR